jgi:DHA2 family methylenomycin A resistance protein-like MFS transporter
MLKGKSITLFVASLACFMVILDTTVVNVAIHGIRESFAASLSGLQWVIDGYALSFACALLSAGAVADRMGPRLAVAIGMSIFLVTSLLCGLAPSLAMLIAARVAQGFGAALLIPSSLALISRTFTIPRERTKALSIWGGIGGGVAMTAGPVVGGLLTGYLGWRSVFLINVPVGILSLALLRFVPADVNSSAKRGLDLLGQATAMVALAAVTYLFIEGPSQGWQSASAVVSGTIALVSGAAFFVIEKKGSDPMLPLDFFKSREFSLTTAIGFALNFAFYGQLFFLNVFLQEQTGLTPQATGLRFLPQAITGVMFAFLVGQNPHRISSAKAVAFGTASGAIGLVALQAIGLKGNPWIDTLCMGAIGVCIGTPASLVAIMLGRVPTERAGLAGGALNASRQVGGLLGVAILGAIVGHKSSASIHIALGASAAILSFASLGAGILSRSAQPTHEVDLSEALAEAMA